MGGRKSYSYVPVLGDGASVKDGLKSLQTKITDGKYNDAVSVAARVIAVSEPGTRSLFLSLRLAKVGYQLYSVAEKEYNETGDYRSALAHALIKETLHEFTESDPSLVEEGVKICWDRLKDEMGISIAHEEIDDLVVNSIVNVLNNASGVKGFDYGSFLEDACENGIKMLFDAEVGSKENKDALLGRSYQEQKEFEKMLKGASGELAKEIVSRIMNDKESKEDMPEKITKSILEQVLNEAIDKYTSS